MPSRQVSSGATHFAFVSTSNAHIFLAGGVRLGTPAMTTRGVTEDGFKQIAEFLHRGVEIALAVQEQAQSRKLVDFISALEGNEALCNLKEDVEKFCGTLDFP